MLVWQQLFYFMKFIVKDTPEIIFLDNHLLVIDKPCGWLTQPSPECFESLETWGKKFLKEKFDKKGNVFLEAAHRLDKVASGIVLFARTSKALSRIQESLREGQWKKTYLALVEGHFAKKADVLEDFLTHDEFHATKSLHGKKAILSYKVLQESADQSLLEIDLQTGRYHQIRIQLSSRGHPIIGDHKYGSRTFFAKNGIALQHQSLEMIHPVTREKIVFEIK